MVEKIAGVEKKSWIPEVPKERIRDLAERIKPVMRFALGEKGLFRSPEGYLYHIKPVDLFGITFTWLPESDEKAVGLKPLCVITTYHTYAYYGFFKPTIAEVLAQIPAEHLDKVVAFEIIGSPETVDDLNREAEALNVGYHVAITQLYVRE